MNSLEPCSGSAILGLCCSYSGKVRETVCSMRLSWGLGRSEGCGRVKAPHRGALLLGILLQVGNGISVMTKGGGREKGFEIV